MFNAFIIWLKGGKGAATKQAELDAANSAPYKLEPVNKEEKLEQLALQNGDMDAPKELVERAAGLSEESTPVKPKAKRGSRTKSTDSTVKATKPRAPKKPKMTVAK